MSYRNYDTLLLTEKGIFLPFLNSSLDIVAKIFGLVQDQQRYPGNYSETSVPVTGSNISQSGDITITLSEFVCNSESLNVSVFIESEEPFSETFRENTANTDEEVNVSLMLTAEQSAEFAGGPLDFSEVPYIEVQGSFQDEYSFAGAFRIDFNLYLYAEYEIPDSFTLDLKITGISSPYGNSPLAISGEWNFSSRITKQDVNTKIVEVNKYAPSGIGILNVRVTPYEIIVEDGYNESKIQPGYEEICLCYIV